MTFFLHIRQRASQADVRIAGRPYIVSFYEHQEFF
jgi:hypothetical protein